jgi:hypothetical protein
VERRQIRLSFSVPDGSLEFTGGELDVWAEHLFWCYRRLGVEAGATIAVQDFGSSPLSFLGSRLLMPGLEQGVAERFAGRFVCLDASVERASLTPVLLRQFAVDCLVVRAEVAVPLVDAARRHGLDLGAAVKKIVVAWDGEGPLRRPAGSGVLLHVEPSLLIAPECDACRGFHLRLGFYGVEGDRVRNLCHRSASPFVLGDRWAVRSGCSRWPGEAALVEIEAESVGGVA